MHELMNLNFEGTPVRVITADDGTPCSSAGGATATTSNDPNNSSKGHTMHELMNLNFEGTPVRVITADDGTPRWALADVCAACGIANPYNVAARLDDRQKGLHTVETLGGPQKITVVNEDGLYDVILDSRNIANPYNVAARLDDRQKGLHTVETLGGPQKITVVNEDGLYDVILDSRKPEARRFRKWVTGEVLPSIRKHGAYMTPDTIRQALADPDTLIMLATRLKEETEERVAAQERVRVLEPKARAYEDFCEAPDLLTVRDAAAQLTTAGLPIRECELRAWMLDHEWIYRHNGAYKPYAAHSIAGHLRLVPPKRSAGLPIRECELRAWMLDHEWIYRHNGAYKPYAAHSIAGHLRLVPPKRSGRHRDGTPFPFDPTCKVTRRGLCLLYQRIGAERMRDQLQYTDTQYSFDDQEV